MMKLTLEQRYTAYCLALAEYRTNYYDACHGFGFCALFKFEIEFGFELYDRFEETLPELYALKPKDARLSWFAGDEQGWAKRAKLLKKCIEELEAKIKW